jgi:hypothetical protein
MTKTHSVDTAMQETMNRCRKHLFDPFRALNHVIRCEKRLDYNYVGCSDQQRRPTVPTSIEITLRHLMMLHAIEVKF